MIDIKHIELPPDNIALQQHIKAIWFLEGNLPDDTVLSSLDIPNGETQLIIHLAGSFIGQKADGRNKVYTDSFFRGQQLSHTILHKGGQFKMLGITFNPSGLSYFQKTSLINFTNKIVPLQEVFTWNIEILKSLTDFKDQKQSIENYFLSLLHESPTSIDIIEQLIQIIQERKGIGKVKDLLLDFQISQKHIERLFLQYVGLTPKQFAQQIRLKSVISDLHKGEKNLMDLVAEYEFHDQAHLNKEIKAFTDFSPGKFDKHIITFNHSYPDSFL